MWLLTFIDAIGIIELIRAAVGSSMPSYAQQPNKWKYWGVKCWSIIPSHNTSHVYASSTKVYRNHHQIGCHSLDMFSRRPKYYVRRSLSTHTNEIFILLWCTFKFWHESSMPYFVILPCLGGMQQNTAAKPHIKLQKQQLPTK